MCFRRNLAHSIALKTVCLACHSAFKSLEPPCERRTHPQSPQPPQPPLLGAIGGGALSYGLFCPGHKKRPESPTVAFVLQKQRLHFAAAPVLYRECQLLARQVVLPQKVSHEVDTPRVEQLGVQIRNLGPRNSTEMGGEDRRGEGRVLVRQPS